MDNKLEQERTRLIAPANIYGLTDHRVITQSRIVDKLACDTYRGDAHAPDRS